MRLVMVMIMIMIIISWVKFLREIPALICHFKFEITRLPWQPSVRLSVADYSVPRWGRNFKMLGIKMSGHKKTL